MKTVKPENLAKAISDILDEFKDATEEAVSYAIIETAEEAVKDLRAANPPGSGKYGSWTKYNNGWDRTKLSGKKGNYNSIVHNKKHYQLTHLLEYGHALRGGGQARAFPHIAPVNEKCESNLMKNIKKRIKP